MSDSAIIATPFIVPLNPVPSQTLDVTLNNQLCRINVFTKDIRVPVKPSHSIVTDPPIFERIAPIFLDLYLNDVLCIGGVLCLTGVKLIRDKYLGFVGDLAFNDLKQLGEDPQVSGLGSRWILTYWPSIA